MPTVNSGSFEETKVSSIQTKSTRSLMSTDEWSNAVQILAKHSIGAGMLIRNPAIDLARAQWRQVRAAEETVSRSLLQVPSSGPEALGFFEIPKDELKEECRRIYMSGPEKDPFGFQACLGIGTGKGKYQLQALGPSPRSTVQMGSGVSCSPAGGTFGNRERIFWLSENGTIYCYTKALPGDPTVGQTAAPVAIGTIFDLGGPPVSGLFKNQLLLGDVSQGVLFATATDGTLYGVQLNNLNGPVGSPFCTLGGYATASLGTCQAGVAVPGAFIDYARNRLLTLSNLGELREFSFTASPGSLILSNAGAPVNLSRLTGIGSEEYFVANPVAFLGTVSVGSWVKDDVDPTSDYGRYFSYTWDDAEEQSSVLDFPNKLPGPLDWTFGSPNRIDWAIVPTGNYLSYIYRNGGTYTANRSRALVVDNTSPGSGHPGAINPTFVRPDNEGIINIPQMGRNDTVFVQNAGALFSLNYSGATPLARVVNFKSLARTWYTKTATGAAGFCTSGVPLRYTQNLCGPLWDYVEGFSNPSADALLVCDNGPGPDGSTRTFLNRYTYNLNHLSAPTLAASFDLRLTGNADEVAGTQLPGMSLGQLGDGRVYFSTSNHQSNPTKRAVLWLSPRQ